MEVEVVLVFSAEEDLFSFHFPDLLLHLLQKILKLFPLAGRFPGTVIKMEIPLMFLLHAGDRCFHTCSVNMVSADKAIPLRFKSVSMFFDD